MENQNVEKSGNKTFSPQVEAARASIWAKLNEKKPSEPEAHYGLGTIQASGNGVYGGLLTPAQVECIREIQHRCFKIDLEVEEINTRLVNAELNHVLPRLYMVEVTDLLHKIDKMVQEVKANAAKMGVAAVQPKVNMAYLNYRLRGEGSRADLERAAVQAAAKRKEKVL